MNHMQAFREELELTDQQVDQIETMRTEHQLAMIDRRAELQKAELRLRKLMQEGDAPERDVNAAIDEVARLRADMQKARYQQHQQMLSVLTDAQRDKLEQLMEERHDTRREFRQERRQMRDDMQGQRQGFRDRRF
jgi:Spy/CpxP family protein refolding chaperone